MTRNLRGKLDYVERKRCCHITFNFNTFKTSVQVLSKDILLSIFIMEPGGGVCAYKLRAHCIAERFVTRIITLMKSWTGNASDSEGNKFDIRPAEGLF